MVQGPTLHPDTTIPLRNLPVTYLALVVSRSTSIVNMQGPQICDRASLIQASISLTLYILLTRRQNASSLERNICQAHAGGC